MESFLKRFRDEIITLNLFKSGLNGAGIIRQERWSTRIYLFLLVSALVILIIYVGLGAQTTHVVVNNPSLEKFEILQVKYAETLRCPCSQIAIKYKSFLQIKPVYHQVRVSKFDDFLLACTQKLTNIVDMFQLIRHARMDFCCFRNQCFICLANGCSHCDQCSCTTASNFLCQHPTGKFLCYA